MIHVHQLLLTVLLTFSIAAKAQKKELVLFLKEGRIKTSYNITDGAIEDFNSKAVQHKNKTLAILQFESLPTAETRNYLSGRGIELLDYIPENAYTASVSGKLNPGVLKRAGVRTLLQPTPKQKMHPALAKGNIPEWAAKVKGVVDVWVQFPKTYTAEEVMLYLREKKIKVLSAEQQVYRVLSLRVSTSRLKELASLPFIEYIQLVPPEVQPLNMNSRNASRAGVLNASVQDGGKGLNGEGVVIGIGDAGGVESHADLSGSRLINMISGSDVSHAIHVSTTAAGAGVVNELYRGYASKATIISQGMSGIIYNAPDYVRDYGMVITNNSYGVGGIGCGYYGEYDIRSRLLDQQAFDFPYLQHVFAAGNDGGGACDPYPPGYRTTFGSFQAAKNVLTVGATEWNGTPWVGSSRGPVQDGRTKPEITAMGAAVYSGTLDNSYKYGWGTSFAAPAVTGGLALLYQRYRQMHGGQNPKSGLMKALMCNGGADLGNKGTDYQYGFGWMNLLRSVEMLEKEQYRVGSITDGATQNYTIEIPANTAQVKVMLYWTDPPASLLSSHSLVNDLDLSLNSPSAISYLPQKLDTSAAGMLNTATTGVDHINNMEQVVVDNPTAGTYTINVTGVVAQNPSQEYYVVYDIIPVSTTVAYPAGGEGLVPGETVQLNWESYGDPANTFTVKYSTDNGATWTNIATSIDPGARRVGWTVPNINTTEALIQVEREGSSIAGVSHPFTIIGVPSVSLSSVQCEGYMAINWTAVVGATDYEVMMKRGNEMVPVAITTNTTYTLSSLSPDSSYWMSVRARLDGKPGRRAIAVSRKPSNGTCAGSISDNDLKVEAIVAPTVGRKATSTELSNNESVTIRIKNLDDVPVAGFTASYKLNDNNWVSEPVNVTIAAGATYDHTFAATEDLSALGSYSLVAAVENNLLDTVRINDTLYRVVRQLDNPPINLAAPFFDDLESASAAVYIKDTMGLAGIDRYDFTDSSTHGRLSTLVSWGAFAGTKSLMLGSNKYYGDPAGVESVIGTYNLQGYNANINDIRLNFKAFRWVGSNATSKVWVRGSDEQSWIELLNLAFPLYNDSIIRYIELSDSLLKYGQNFSSSFQLSWGVTPGVSTLTLDDIMIQEVFDDLQMLNIDAAIHLSCGNEPLQITVRNSSNKELINVPVKFCIDNGAWVTEIIPFIAANTTLQYKFSTPLSFSTSGTHALKALVDFPTDNVRVNDTLVTYVSYAPVVKTFPYLQNFEEGDGGWYTTANYSSWEYGTPSSFLIDKAASGAKAWKTGNYEGEENSELYSPCFEIGGMVNPTLSFSIAMDLDGCRDTTCDAAWVDYSTDNKTWNWLDDTASAGTNWYTPYDLGAWGERKTRWHVVTMSLPKNVGLLRLRINRYRHPAVHTEGLAIDDIHIYDSAKSICHGPSPSITVSKTVSGNEWVDFESEGKLIASINPNGQNMGSTDVQAFINSEPVRYTNQQYYHNRNITIKPQNTSLSDSVTVRFYFLDSEAEALIAATGCSGCIKPESAYDLGVSKYSDPDKTKENGSIEDNNTAYWSFLPSGKVTLVPFQKGYYAEFKVKDFSEFWLSSNNMSGWQSLPVTLLSFIAQKATGEDVLLKWSIAQETKVSHYEVELARGEADLRAGRFVNIAEIKAVGNTAAGENYYYKDQEANKLTARYYRLKIVDSDGSFVYSPVRSVLFGPAATWQIYPNPSTGVFSLVYQLNHADRIEAYVYDATGRRVKQYKKDGNGTLQRLAIDLSFSSFASGIYMLQTLVNGEKQFFKLHKL